MDASNNWDPIELLMIEHLVQRFDVFWKGKLIKMYKQFQVFLLKSRNVRFIPKWVRLIPNLTNPGLFSSDFWLTQPKCNEIWSEKPFGATLAQLGPNGHSCSSQLSGVIVLHRVVRCCQMWQIWVILRYVAFCVTALTYIFKCPICVQFEANFGALVFAIYHRVWVLSDCFKI